MIRKVLRQMWYVIALACIPCTIYSTYEEEFGKLSPQKKADKLRDVMRSEDRAGALWLINNGADLTEHSIQGESLICAIMRAEIKMPGILQMAIDKGAPVCALVSDGTLEKFGINLLHEDILSFAARVDELEENLNESEKKAKALAPFTVLLKNGGNKQINYPNCEGTTPLVSVLQGVIKYPRRINTQKRKDLTLEWIKLLVRSGAHLCLVVNGKQSAYEIAQSMRLDFPEVVEFFNVQNPSGFAAIPSEEEVRNFLGRQDLHFTFKDVSPTFFGQRFQSNQPDMSSAPTSLFIQGMPGYPPYPSPYQNPYPQIYPGMEAQFSGYYPPQYPDPYSPVMHHQQPPQFVGQQIAAIFLNESRGSEVYSNVGILDLLCDAIDTGDAGEVSKYFAMLSDKSKASEASDLINNCYDTKENEGYSLMYHAFTAKLPNEEKAKLLRGLIACGAQVDAPIKKGKKAKSTLLHSNFAIKSIFSMKDMRGKATTDELYETMHASILPYQIIFDNGAGSIIDSKNSKSQTPLLCLLDSLAKKLKEKTPNEEQKNNIIELVRLFLKYKPSLDASDAKGNTPLSVAEKIKTKYGFSELNDLLKKRYSEKKK